MVEGSKYRQRHFTEFVFDHTTKELAQLIHAPFFQLSGINKLNGGVDRKIVPVIPFIAAHPITWETTNQHAVVFTTQVVQKRLLHSLCNEAAGLSSTKPMAMAPGPKTF